MVEVSLWVGLGTLLVGIVAVWRIIVIERALDERMDEIDRSLGSVVGMIIEKIDNFSTHMPEISLINQNPIGQILDFLKGNAPQESVINSQPKPRDSSGQFVEVIPEDGKRQEESNETT